MKKFKKCLFVIFSLASLLLSSACKDDVTNETPQAPATGGIGEIKPPPTPPAPAVANVSVSKVRGMSPDGTYTPSEVIRVGVELNYAVKLQGGAPVLSLELDNAVVNATFVNHSNYSSILLFEYVVQSGDRSSDLKTTGVNALSLGGAVMSVKDYTNFNFTASLPAEGAAGSLSGESQMVVSQGDSFSGPVVGSQWHIYDGDFWDADFDGIHNNDGDKTAFVSEGKLYLLAAGSDLFNSSHEYVSLYLDQQTGDFDYSVKLESVSNTNAWSKAGIVVSNDLTNLNQAGNYQCLMTQSQKIIVQYSSLGSGKINKRVIAGVSQFPVWIRVQKLGSNFNCFYKYASTDPWTAHSANSQVVLSIDAFFDVGLASSSKVAGEPMLAVFDDFTNENP